MLRRTTSSSLNRMTTTSRTSAKKMLNSSWDSTHPCRTPCVTKNQSDSSPSSMRTRARIPSWNWRMTSISFAGIPALASTFHSISRSTGSYAFFKSTKHM
ncbi:unnamed protein product [Ectocarpus sp. CCAP 1310/34]|nr:unnamed protein product [Ectocarpus sp. CCAP 1310/34]